MPAKGQKMSMTEFLGGAPPTDRTLPTGPRQRAEGDDGSFQRNRRYGDDREPSRSEGDSAWRRGPGDGPPSGGGGFGGGDRYGDRGGGYGDRGGYNDRGGGYGGDRYGGGGGDGDSAWRRGGPSGGSSGSGYDRTGSGGAPASSSGGERPRLNLAKRSEASPAPASAASNGAPKKASSNPFGAATAVDTAGRLAKMELKEQEEKEQRKQEREEKENAAANQEEDAKEEVEAETAAETAPEGDDGKEEEGKEDEGNQGAPEGEEGKLQGEEVDEGEKKEEGDKPKRRERKMREPAVVNTRAAMLGDTAAPKKEELGDRRDRHPRDRRTRDAGPPPVVNERFAKFADEARAKAPDRCGGGGDFRRRDDDAPPRAGRFGRDDDGEERFGRFGRSDEGPPPVANSRFAAAAEADGTDRAFRPNIMGRRDEGPAPQNSRFAAAAGMYEADKATQEMERAEMERGPPPPTQNSRFAAAAADHDRDRETEMRDREERYGGGFGRRDDQGPPPVQNSRFAAAVQGDEDYVPHDVRNQMAREREMEREEGGRFGGQEGGRFGGDRGGYDDDRRGGGFGGGGRHGGGRYGDTRGGEAAIPTGPRSKMYEEPPQEFVVPALSKGKMSGVLAPKKREEAEVLAPVEAPLTLPGEDAAAAKARLEKARKEKEEKAAAEKKAAEEAAAAKAVAEKAAAEQAAKAAAAEGKLLDEFVSGTKRGEDLQRWCAAQGAVLPPIEKLISHLLAEKCAAKPDPECAWAAPGAHGAALASLAADDADAQMQVLWAIQKHCDAIGFPKVDEEYVVQAMFRAMYKYDLVEPGAFDLWKEDESEENSRGKMKAVIQTMDWFAWLEEDDDSEEEEEYEEEEE